MGEGEARHIILGPFRGVLPNSTIIDLYNSDSEGGKIVYYNLILKVKDVHIFWNIGQFDVQLNKLMNVKVPVMSLLYNMQ